MRRQEQAIRYGPGTSGIVVSNALQRGSGQPEAASFPQRRLSGLIRVQMIDDSGQVLPKKVLRSRAFKEVSCLLLKDQVRKSV